MSVSDTATPEAKNSLPRVASGAGVFVGIFLLLGGLGHLSGVQAALERAAATPDESTFILILPALLLISAGAINLGLCIPLWRGLGWSINSALIANVLTTAYVAYLLSAGVPDHPIGTFLAILASFVVLLGALRAGLVWPAPATDSD
ncbi:MAG: hypothetical protein AAGE01_24895 [Pseudomonadota bacterium]